MDPNKLLFYDDRLRGYCVYCGSSNDTNDHAPSKAFLDDPFTKGSPRVDSCRPCNEGFSLDEEYVSCFIECVVCGTTDHTKLTRPKIAKTLSARPKLAARIEKAKNTDSKSDETVWAPELDRVRNVISKLAKAHSAYELGLPRLDAPDLCAFMPLVAMSHEQRREFENPSDTGPALWPEIGSRAFLRLFGESTDKMEFIDGWIVVQPGRYRYRVDQMRRGDCVQFVLSEYLACRVVWQ